MTSKPKGMMRLAQGGLVAALMAGGWGVQPLLADQHETACPWIVQPEEPLFGLGAANATYEILFTGKSADENFYGFTVSDHRLARELTNGGGLPDLEKNGRSLETVEQDGTIVYQVAADSILPRTIYLLAADMPIKPLERIDARIDPARPIAVGLRTRGASDVTGPMPRRTVPGVEIVTAGAEPEEAQRAILSTSYEPEFQLCAYQVSWN